MIKSDVYPSVLDTYNQFSRPSLPIIHFPESSDGSDNPPVEQRIAHLHEVLVHDVTKHPSHQKAIQHLADKFEIFAPNEHPNPFLTIIQKGVKTRSTIRRRAQAIGDDLQRAIDTINDPQWDRRKISIDGHSDPAVKNIAQWFLKEFHWFNTASFEMGCLNLSERFTLFEKAAKLRQHIAEGRQSALTPKLIKLIDRLTPKILHPHYDPKKNRERFSEDLELEILSRLPAELLHVENNITLIRKYITQQPRLGYELLSQWINEKQIPLHTLNLTHIELERIKPHILHLNLTGMSFNRWTSSQISQWIESFPNIKSLRISTSKIRHLSANVVNLESLDCSDCRQLLGLPNGMINLKILRCENCRLFKNIPEDLQNLEILECSGCIQMKKIPSRMRALRIFNCKECLLFTQLPSEMQVLKELNCSGCKKLFLLPDGLTALKYLNCNNSPLIQNIPNDMMSLEVLNCSHCPIIVEIPEEIRALKHLNCSYCRSIQRLPLELPFLEFLDSSFCRSIEIFPSRMENLRHLQCTCCYKLRALPQDTTNLEALICNLCSGLESIPNHLPRLKRLNYNFCKNLLGPFPKVVGAP